MFSLYDPGGSREFSVHRPPALQAPRRTPACATIVCAPTLGRHPISGFIGSGSSPKLSFYQLFGPCSSRPAPQNSAIISFLDLARLGPLPKTQLLSAFWTLLVAARSAKLSFYQLFGPCSSRPAPQNSAFISFLDLARLGLLRKTQLLSAFWTLLVAARSAKLSFYQLFGPCSP